MVANREDSERPEKDVLQRRRRKRVPARFRRLTKERLRANERERLRSGLLRDAFEALRTVVPRHSEILVREGEDGFSVRESDSELTRFELLLSAIHYIETLSEKLVTVADESGCQHKIKTSPEARAADKRSRPQALGQIESEFDSDIGDEARAAHTSSQMWTFDHADNLSSEDGVDFSSDGSEFSSSSLSPGSSHCVNTGAVEFTKPSFHPQQYAAFLSNTDCLTSDGHLGHDTLAAGILGVDDALKYDLFDEAKLYDQHDDCINGKDVFFGFSQNLLNAKSDTS